MSLSKKQYREMGYLPQGMVNYLALLGWGDGTENEFFTLEDLGRSFLLTVVTLLSSLAFLISSLNVCS